MAAKTTAKTKSVATEVENVVAEPAVETIDQLKSNVKNMLGETSC